MSRVLFVTLLMFIILFTYVKSDYATTKKIESVIKTPSIIKVTPIPHCVKYHHGKCILCDEDYVISREKCEKKNTGSSNPIKGKIFKIAKIDGKSFSIPMTINFKS